MAISINVDANKLYSFSQYVSNFNKLINEECAELKKATDRLENSMDEISMETIVKTIQEISKIIEGADPILLNLENRIKGYASFIESISKQLRN